MLTMLRRQQIYCMERNKAYMATQATKAWGECEDFKAKHPQLKPTQLFTSMRRGKRKKLAPNTAIGQLLEVEEKAMAKIRAFVEHPFRVIKRQFGYVKVRYRGLAKNAAQQTTLFALSNLWMVRGKLMAG
jgi:transposase, IS5 family